MNKRLYYVSAEMGCAIRSASSIASAKKEAREEVGNALKYVRRATKSDVAWVKMMGGRVPEGLVDKDES